MARSIVVNHGGEVSEFAITRVSREKIYGKKRRIVVDEDGNECGTASLTRDGSALLPKGSVAMVYLNDSFEICERSDLNAIDGEGNPLDPVDSTLGVEQTLEGPIDPQRMLDHIAKAVYQLDPASLSDALAAALESGEIFETRFNYRKGFDESPAFILKSDEGYFAVLGDPAEFDFLRPEEGPELEEAEDDDDDPFDDDLDFSF